MIMKGARNDITFIGSVFCFAGGMLALSFLLALHLSPKDYGTYAFFMVLVGAGYSFINAVFVSPTNVLLNKEGFSSADIFPIISGPLCTVLLGGATLIFVAIWNIENHWSVAFILAAGSLLYWSRWFLRGWFINKSETAVAAASEISTGLSLLLSTLLLSLVFTPKLQTAGAIVMLSATFGLAPFVVKSSTRKRSLKTAQGFAPMFRRYALPNLVGVASIHAVTSSHAYFIVFAFGPAAFAPIAFAMLVFRPTAIFAQSLTTLAVPKLSKLLVGRETSSQTSLNKKAGLMFVIWLLNCLLAVLILTFLQSNTASFSMDVDELTAPLILFSLIAIVNASRHLLRAYLQADGRFRDLASINIKAAAISVLLVIACGGLVGPTFSLIGLLVGEITASLLIYREYQQGVYSSAELVHDR